MPISTFELMNIGDCNSEANLANEKSSLTRQDLAMYFTKSGQCRIMNSYSKVPHDFKFFMLSLLPGDQSYNGTKKRAIEYLKEAIPSSPDSVWVLLTNNITSKNHYMPLTPWILGHRFGHTQMIDRSLATPNRPVFQAIKEFAQATFEGDILRRFDADAGDHCLGPGEVYRYLGFFLITGRAARTCQMTNELEVFAELCAQYLVTGKVTVASVDDIMARANVFMGRVPDNRPAMSRYCCNMAEELEVLHAKGRGQLIEYNLQVLERKLNEAMFDYVNRCKGRVNYF